jgi:hypothetical protein
LTGKLALNGLNHINGMAAERKTTYRRAHAGLA